MTEGSEAAVTQDSSPDEGGGSLDVLRGHTYALLANLLARAPSSELLSRLADIPEAGESSESALGGAWAMLQAAARKTTPAAVADEYQDLFIGVGRGEVMPYGSWYLTGFLMEKPLAMLRTDLARLGFERQDDVSEPEDHIAALCDIMGMIAASEPSQQRAFFAAHIAPWAGRFFDDLQQATSARFYRAVGFFGRRFLDIEIRYLDVTVKPVAPREAPAVAQ